MPGGGVVVFCASYKDSVDKSRLLHMFTFSSRFWYQTTAWGPCISHNIGCLAWKIPAEE